MQYDANSCLATYDKNLMALIVLFTDFMPTEKLSFVLKILDSHPETTSQTKKH